MSKVIGMLLALVVFCAMPALAFAQDESENVASGNTQDADIEQEGEGGGNASGGDDGGASGGTGNVGNQAAICQQNAGEDATCNIDQSQEFGGDTFVRGHGGGDDDNGHGHGGGVTHHGGGVGGGGVQSVTLARTGFDAWMLALLGGLSLAGGLGLLAAQRRGRLSA
jgi:type II secretory pathway pseudopilin PulG